MIYDKDFLLELDNYTEKEIYARIINLNFEEQPIEQLEGKVTGGSINIDGTSAVRRTFSLSLVADEININEYLWGLKTKCKVEIGVKNIIDSKYPDIIWFKQGIYVITAFNISHNANNYTISISGKDKMCLLNGELGGNLTSSIDFGVETFYDIENQITTYTHIPIKKIIYESLHTYGNELYSNIVINDLDEAAVELLDYKGDRPMYLIMSVDGIAENSNFTMNGDTMIYLADTNIQVYLDNNKNDKDNQIIYDTRLNIGNEVSQNEPTKVYYNDPNKLYTIAQVGYGETAGYRITELTYPGDLISNIGESLTSIYDKIVSLLGTYEYFYDVDGRFIFQKKRIYTGTAWNNLTTSDDGTYAESAALSSASIYTFTGSNLITSFQNSPNLTNLRNDYSVWGTRETISGVELPIHYRYAIDIKPDIYTQIRITPDDLEIYKIKYPDGKFKARAKDSTEKDEWNIILNPEGTKEEDLVEIEICEVFTSSNYDWRELIYQMAADYYAYNQLDDFLVKVAAANPQYPTGKTGYEQYYIDLQGFWRQLYDPKPEPSYEEQFVEEDSVTSIEGIYIKGRYEKVENITEYKTEEERMKLYALIDPPELNTNKELDKNQIIGKELHPLLDAIPIDYYGSIEDDENNSTLNYSNEFYVVGKNNELVPVNSRTKDIIDKEELYVTSAQYGNQKLIMADRYLQDLDIYKYVDDDKYYAVNDLDPEIKELYYKNGKLQVYMVQSPLTIEAKVPVSEDLPVNTYITYYEQGYKYINDIADSKKYWSKDIITNPEGMNFWIDFMDATSELGKFSVSAIGDRTKVVNDKDVKSIYYREVPNLLFVTPEQRTQIDLEDKTGYGILNITKDVENLFNISSQGKSAQDKIDELLYAHSYCVENITLQTIPIYYLEPNARITVKDNESKINGDYTVNRITLPLTYNGIMSITATKIPERLL